jgi:hypothetical protein
MKNKIYVLLLLVLTLFLFSGIYGQQTVSKEMSEKVKKDRELPYRASQQDIDDDIISVGVHLGV